MINLTIVEALKKLNSGEITSVELTKSYLERIEKYSNLILCHISQCVPDNFLSVQQM